MSVRLLVALCLLSLACARNAPPSATPPADDLITAAAMREDFASLYDRLESAHYDVYAHRSKAEYDTLFATMLASIDAPVTRLDAVRMVQRFLAYGNVGHARTDDAFAEFARYRTAGGTMIPLFLRVDDGRAFLTRAATADGTPAAGAEVVRVDGQPVIEWLDAMSAWVSAERPYMDYAQLERTLPIAIWLEHGALPSLRIETAEKAFEIPALAPDAFRALMTRHPAPGPGVDFDTRELRFLEEGLAYLRPGPFHNIEAASEGPAPSYDDSAYRRFLDDAFTKILAAGTEDLIIDLRNNGGGDNSFSDPMIAWFATRPFRFASRFVLKASAETKAWYDKQSASGEIESGCLLARMIETERSQPNGTRYALELPMVEPRPGPRYSGRVHVLVNRHSYSNAASVAAIIQDYGFGTIYGEETADVPTSYASVLYFELPNSGITVTYPKSYFVRPSGDEGLHGVIPEVAIESDPKSGEDEVLRAVIARIRG